MCIVMTGMCARIPGGSTWITLGAKNRLLHTVIHLLEAPSSEARQDAQTVLEEPFSGSPYSGTVSCKEGLLKDVT